MLLEVSEGAGEGVRKEETCDCRRGNEIEANQGIDTEASLLLIK